MKKVVSFVLAVMFCLILFSLSPADRISAFQSGEAPQQSAISDSVGSPVENPQLVKFMADGVLIVEKAVEYGSSLGDELPALTEKSNCKAHWVLPDGTYLEADTPITQDLTATQSYELLKASGSAGSIVVDLTIPEGTLPAGAVFSLSAADGESYHDAIESAAGSTIGRVRAVSMCFVDSDGDKVPLAEGSSVSVSMYSSILGDASVVYAMLINEGGEAVKIGEGTGGRVNFDTSDFFVFALAEPARITGDLDGQSMPLAMNINNKWVAMQSDTVFDPTTGTTRQAALVLTADNQNEVTNWTFHQAPEGQDFYYISANGGYLNMGSTNGIPVILSSTPQAIKVDRKENGSLRLMMDKACVNQSGNNPERGFASYSCSNGANEIFWPAWSSSFVVTVTYNNNGGSAGAPGAVKTYSGDKITLASYSGTKSVDSGTDNAKFYKFTGWSTKNNSIEPEYLAGAEFTVPDSNVTLYAVWREALAITFDRNGAGNANSYTLYDPGVKVTLPKSWGTNKNHKLAGWGYSRYDAAENAFTEIIMPNYNLTLYAIWTGESTVSFNINGGTGVTPASETKAPGEKVTFPGGDGFSYEGYEFQGWIEVSDYMTNPIKSVKNNDGDVTDIYYHRIYTPGEEYTVTNSDITFYAKWSLIEPSETVNFYIRSDGTIPDEPSSYSSSRYSAGIEKKNNIISKRWIVDNDIRKPIAKDADGNELNYVDNLVAANMVSLPSDSELKAKVPSYDPEIDYVIWYVLKVEGSRTWHVDGTILHRDKVGIAYDMNAPEGLVRNVPLGYQTARNTVVTIGASGGPNNNVLEPIRVGYIFKGWNLKRDGSGNMYQSNANYTLSENTVLYAQWVPIKVYLTPNSDGKIYDGTPLTNDGYKVELTSPLPDGQFIRASVIGSQTDVGSSVNQISSWWIVDADGNPIVDDDSGQNLADFFEAAVLNTGKLTVTKRPLVVSTGSDTKIYDGTPLTKDEAALGPLSKSDGTTAGGLVEGETAIVRAVGSITETGTKRNGYELTWVTAKESNYEIVREDLGSLTVTPRTLKITADSNEKVYDGSYLTQKTWTVDDGLVNGDEIKRVTITGRQKNVGTSDNVPSGAIIKSADGRNDMTACYSIEYINGELKVTPRPVIVRAEDKTKVYGTADPDLTTVVENLVYGESIDYVVDRADGEDVDNYTITPSGASVQGNYSVTYVTGTLVITPKEVIVKADDKSKTYGDNDPDLTAVVSGLADRDRGRTDLISYTISREEGEYVCKVFAEDGKSCKEKAYVITPAGEARQGNYTVRYENGAFTIDPRKLTITSATLEEVYNGKVWNASQYTDDRNLIPGDAIFSLDFTDPFIKDAGTKVNYISNAVIKDHSGEGVDVSANYEIIYVNGNLTITPITMRITAGTKAKKYDGTPLVYDYYEASHALGEGDVMTVTVEGSQLEVGSTPNIAKNAVILNADGVDVTDRNYIIEEYIPGTLTVWDVTTEVIITAGTKDKTYDGIELTDDSYKVTGLEDGDYIHTIKITGSQTRVNSQKPTDNVPSDVVIYNAEGRDVTAKYRNIRYVNGKLTVNPRPLSITTATAEKMYDAAALTDHNYTVVGLADGDGIKPDSLTITGSRTNVGKSRNDTLRDARIVNPDGEDVTDCYNVTYIVGTLKVTPRPVIVTADSFEKEYGQKDPVFTARVEGTLGDDTVEYDLYRDTDPENENPGRYPIFAEGEREQGNYIVTYIPGTLTITWNPTSYVVEKIWLDENNRDGVRPVSLGVTLVGSDGTARTRRLTEANGWKAVISDLPVYSGGQPITYTWSEEKVEGYTGTSVVNGSVTTFTNKHERALTSVRVTKVWDDNDNAGGVRPVSLGVILRGNGENILGVSLNPANNWSYTAENLPVNANGSPVDYVWYEQTVGGGYYPVSSTVSGNLTTFVNSNLYNLVIHYRYADGTEAFADYTARLAAGETFAVDSQELKGYVVSLISVVGIMPSHDLEFIVIYTPEGEPVITPTPTPAPRPDENPEDKPKPTPIPGKEIPEPRHVEPDENHKIVIPVPEFLVDIDDLETALGLGEVFISNSGYAIE